MVFKESKMNIQPLEDLFEKLTVSLPADKARHFTYGLVLFAIITVLFVLFRVPEPILAAFLLTAIIAIGKEAYDYVNPNHTFDVMDAVYTIIPSAIFIVLYYVIEIFK